MRAIRLHELGGSEVLRYEDVSEPQLDATEVLIKVAAAGVNYSDLSWREGRHAIPQPLPAVLGLEVAGTISHVGAEINDFVPGQRVMALVGGGGYAEYAKAPADAIYAIPDTLGFEAAAGMPVVFLTAYHILKTCARVQSHDFVLVHAGASGVGTVAIQLAKLWGARVFATASTERKLERIRELGVGEVINYSEKDFVSEVLRMTERRGVDVVLEGVGGEVLTKSLACLVPMGRLVIYGRASGSLPVLDSSQIFNRNITVSGLHLGMPPWHAAMHRRVMRELIEMVGTGALLPVIDTTFPLARASDAHQYLSERKTMGKVVLVP